MHADMRMADPKPTFSYLVSELAKLHPNLSYIHVVEPRAQGNMDREVQEGEVSLVAFHDFCDSAHRLFYA